MTEDTIDATDDESTTTAAVRELLAAPHADRIPHPAGATVGGDPVVAIFRTTQLRRTETTYIIVTSADDTIYTSWESDHCSECDANVKHESSIGTPPKAAQQDRARANCPHASLASSAFHIDNSGACEDCGGWSIETTEHAHPHVPGAVAMVDEHCGDCGVQRLDGL